MAERRKYIEVKLPLIGESIQALGTLENLQGKTIKLDLTRKLRGKGLILTFKIFNHEGKLVGIPKKMELVKQYIQRMTRKRTNYVEDSFKTNCSDIQVIVKPLLVTRKRVSRVVRKNLRNTCKEYLVEYLKQREYSQVCSELLDGTFQKALLPKLKKIYPLSFCDLRVFETKDSDKLDLAKASEETIVEEAHLIEPEKEKSEEEPKKDDN